MVEENISQEFRLKTIDETRNYFLEEIKQNELMSKKHKKVCTTLNYYCNNYCGYYCRNYEFCNGIENLCDNWRN